MALIVKYGSSLPLSTTLDQVAVGFCQPRLEISYNGPARFSFRLHVAQHTRPIPFRSVISFEDDDNPGVLLFLGHVWEIIPQESNIVDYVCYDSTMRARNEITIMSGEHSSTNVIPRLVFNAKIDNDEDYAYAVANDVDVASILSTIMSNASSELANCQAGGLGTYPTMDYKPQEKLVFESELLGQGIDRMLSLYPQHRIIFEPNARQWNIVKPTTSTAVTLTLNDFTASKKVLSFGIQPNIAQRYTAVHIFGPPVSTVETFTVSGGGLTPLWTAGEASSFETSGPGIPDPVSIGNAGKAWQITDTAKRQGARIFPAETSVSDSQFNVDGTSFQTRLAREPILQATWNGTEWWTVPGIVVDYRNGIVTTPGAVYQKTTSPSTPYDLPSNVRFVYAPLGNPLKVRRPTSGFSGTAATVAGMNVEMRRYDEMLAVGYEKGVPVTTVERLAQYGKLADALLEAYQDIIYTGGCTIEGLDYEFRQLQRRINFAASNGSGGTITTGWESINAIVTDVEYDYENRLTTLTFSSDYAAFLQTSLEELRRILKIRALQIVQILETSLDATGQTIDQTITVRNLLVDEGNVVGEI